MIARPSPPTKDLGIIDQATMTRAEHTLRTTVRVALNEIPAEVRNAWAGKKKTPGWYDVEVASHRIADHLVVEIMKAMDVAEKSWGGPGPNRYPESGVSGKDPK